MVSEYNVRKRDIIADVGDLARNIATVGLQQPIVVQPRGDKFEILIGQRRFLAVKQLRWRDIPARIVGEPMGELEAKATSFSENVQRRDLAPRDKADVCQYLYGRLGSVKAVAERIGVTEQTVRKWLGFAAVPSSLKELVDQGAISPNQASRLWGSVPDEKQAIRVGREIAKLKLTRPAQDRFLTAAEENPSRSVAAMSARAEELRKVKKITFILPDKWRRAIQDASKRLKKDANDIARDATIEWLERFDFFAGP